MLDMTQTELADLAGLGLSTVVDFEKERRQVSAAAIQAVQQALNRAGIEFIDGEWRRTRCPVTKAATEKRLGAPRHALNHIRGRFAPTTK